jgi:wobble nucleotide-excising tRNase
MITTIQLIRNIGKFDSVTAGANIPLDRLTVVYAENGRGKTTLAAILRSLATGESISISERRRLTAQHPPHVVIECDGGPPSAMFQNNAWNRTLSNMTVFDDMFVDENVCSGLDVHAEHRQHLHELILGAQGVNLNRQLQQLVGRIEQHNTELRTRAAAIPAAARGRLSVDEFCDLPARADIDAVLLEAERSLAAAQEHSVVGQTPSFDVISLPRFDLDEIERILQLGLSSLNTAAAARVQTHLAHVGRGGEQWVADGMTRIGHDVATGTEVCPFCAQDLSRSELIADYQGYFSNEYTTLRAQVSETLRQLSNIHGEVATSAFERAVRVAVERRQFWSRFGEFPEIAVDTAAITGSWQASRNQITALLASKQGSPLDRMEVTDEARASVSAYEVQRQLVERLNVELQTANRTIAVIKEQAATANATAISEDLARLRAVRARHMPATAPLCEAYLSEKRAKAATEHEREQARAALDQHRTNVFPGYETSINLYLQRFNAGFRLERVTSTNTRTGPTCTYNVVINNHPVAVAGGPIVAGEPSFRNTLSAGDRNALALAFFFASLDQDPNLADKVVVIDDPISSLDEHRSLTTVQEIRRLAGRAGQVIVLSHSKPLLCNLWERTDHTLRAALEVARDGDGSTLGTWNVDQDCITEYDRRHAMLREYAAQGNGNRRDVAETIRPVLEAFLRVASPEYFRPETLLGQFCGLCEQRVGTPQEILQGPAIQELRDLTEYANRFHHDTNTAWQTEIINDGELAGFVRRALEFARR